MYDACQKYDNLSFFLFVYSIQVLQHFKNISVITLYHNGVWMQQSAQCLL